MIKTLNSKNTPFNKERGVFVFIAECQEDLTTHADTNQHNDNKQEMLTAISTVVDTGSRRGIIAPPQRVIELIPSTTPALTA